MPEQIDHSLITEAEFLNKISPVVARHISNISNSLAMMRSGHFIDAFQRISGSKEGLDYLLQMLADRSMHIQVKGINNENNKNS